MKILISACLLGASCRYNGESKPLEENVIKTLLQKFELVPVCPEIMGGLKTPRNPSEILGGRVLDSEGGDVSEQFERGARETLRFAKLFGCKAALLKQRSPSCGKGEIYDGTHSKTLTQGDGITARALMREGIEIFGESEICSLLQMAKEEKL